VGERVDGRLAVSSAALAPQRRPTFDGKKWPTGAEAGRALEFADDPSIYLGRRHARARRRDDHGSSGGDFEALSIRRSACAC